MSKKMAVLIAFLALLISVLPAIAKGPHPKATGTVTWTARTHLPPEGQLPGIVSTFDAHDIGPGIGSDKGKHEITRPADDTFPGGSLTLTIKCVHVEGNQAWFAGTVSTASGGYSGLEGEVYLYWVEDNSTPGSKGPDEIGGRGYGSIQTACNVVESGGWTGTGIVTDGNLKVHTYE